MATAAPPSSTSFRDRFGIFAECLLTGVWITLAALPLITLPAALAAGSRHLRTVLAHEPSGLRSFTADFHAATRGGLAAGCAYLAAAGLLTLDLLAARAGVPGSAAVGAVGVFGLLTLAVVMLRTATCWQPEASWRTLSATAIRRTATDPMGSCLLLCTPAVIGASAALSPPLAAPALGIAAAAAIAVEQRASK
ncbi:hypothetical protein G5C51_34710 [Streptomyces sp. A7024]|uniref:DUF624 domain-containing protein n=1 Tax=Streptomyces coryli TaxID=1128680 RepID=A0A6G4UCC0_9ACTN|nr:hypothetical protein [Streptomyces coryli]NGN69028.1 hypothetical protein [Streptomyces coryli]